MLFLTFPARTKVLPGTDLVFFHSLMNLRVQNRAQYRAGPEAIPDDLGEEKRKLPTASSRAGWECGRAGGTGQMLD